MERRLALITTALTWVLILAGGVVHSTDSGLACPDWPLCYGSLFPEMKGGVLFEHTHRLIAGTVALLTLFTTVLVWRRYKTRSLRALSLSAFLLVLFQAILGGLTVIFRLPTLVSTAHLAISMIFLSILTILTYKLYNPFQTLKNQKAISIPFSLKKLRPWLSVSLFILYFQMVLGAFVRHTGAGGVCPTIPLCQGSLWPANASSTIYHHMAHRMGGLVVTFFLMVCSYGALKCSKTLKENHSLSRCLQILGLTLPLLLITQILLGIFSVTTHLNLFLVTTHLGGSAFLLINTICLWVLVGEIFKTNSFEKPKPSFVSDLFSLSKARLNALVLLVMSISYFLAPSSKNTLFSQFLFTLLGTFLLVTGASFLNAYFERDIDSLMKRTANRPLPAGRMAGKPILYMGIVLAFIGVPLLTFGVNPLTGFLGTLAFLLYSLVYTPLKAQTSLAALIGALPGAMPPLLGWTAATGQLDLIGLTLFFILFFWQLPHFWAIAIYRKEEYLRAGIKVMPVANGEKFTKKLMIRYSAMLIPFTLFLVPLGIAGKFYFYVALILGITYFLWTCYGQRKLAGALWARGLFVYSLIYLPLLFFTLLLDSRFFL